jgi:hypothetical protein
LGIKGTAVLVKTVACGLMVVGFACSMSGVYAQSAATGSKSRDNRCKAASSNYTIVTTADVSVPALERKLSSYSPAELQALPKNERREVRIVVSGPINEGTVGAAMRSASDEISCRNRDVDEIAVLAYERKEDSDGAYTLGRLEWAPAGGWASMTAAVARSNDRAGYRYTPTFAPKVAAGGSTEPKPTAREFKLYDAMMAYLNAHPNESEDVLMPRIAKKLGVSVKELDDIFLKVEVYKHY